MVFYEIVYSVVLLLTIVIGIPLRQVQSFKLKQIATGGIGFLTVFGVCGIDGLYSLVTAIVNILIIKLTRKHTSGYSFVWCFTFLFVFRCATFFGLPQPTPLANAVQLLMTLKLVSVAIEIRDYRVKSALSKTQQTADQMSIKFQLGLTSEPSSFDILCFSYCYAGIFTGPMFKYRTYHDYLSMDKSVMETIPWQGEVISRLKQVALFAPLYFATAYFFTIEYPKTDSFYKEPLWYRVFYMVPIFFLGRMRFYTAWLLAECAFITMCMGAYPKSQVPRPGHGPTIDSNNKCDSVAKNEEHNFETIRNIDPAGCDFTPTVRLGMRNWNMSVQWWLANYVHKRWPNNLKQYKTVGVMAVSAYWHGIDPGFFCAFLTMPFVMIVEDQLKVLIKFRLPPYLHVPYDWVNWFAKMRAFEYMYMAFALLTWYDTYRYWKSVYFWLHIVCVVVIPICLLVKKPCKRVSIAPTTDDGTKSDKKDQ